MRYASIIFLTDFNPKILVLSFGVGPFFLISLGFAFIKRKKNQFLNFKKNEKFNPCQNLGKKMEIVENTDLIILSQNFGQINPFQIGANHSD